MLPIRSFHTPTTQDKKSPSPHHFFSRARYFWWVKSTFTTPPPFHAKNSNKLFGLALWFSKTNRLFFNRSPLLVCCLRNRDRRSLGELFFYDWSYFREHPLNILKVWQGGLASHGGVIGVILALYLYLKYIQRWIPQLTFLQLLDYVAVPSAFVACFIRLVILSIKKFWGKPT